MPKYVKLSPKEDPSVNLYINADRVILFKESEDYSLYTDIFFDNNSTVTVYESPIDVKDALEEAEDD